MKHGLMVTLDHACGITTDNCGPRTNNHLEEWHNCMKRISWKTHPNLYEVLLEAGGARRQKKRKVIEREQKIKTLADELANGDRDIDSYISAIVVSFDFGCYVSLLYSYTQ